MDEDVFEGVGIEIEFAERNDFIKIMETLTRMGIESAKENKLFQSCHILHKKGRYSILHFKELFVLDGKKETTNINKVDYARRNRIAKMLEETEVLTIISDKDISNMAPESAITTIPKSKKEDWELVAKYTIGGAKK